MDPLVLHLISQHDGNLSISLEQAAAIAGISEDLAVALAREDRFPAHYATRARSRREQPRVFIPRLVEWINAGGTRQYDARAEEETTHATDPLRSEFEWLNAQLAA